MDDSHFKHYTFGTVINALCIVLVFLICYRWLNIELTTVKIIALVVCALGHASFEVYQRKIGGNNTFYESLIDAFYGFSSAIYWTYFIPLALI